MQHSNSLVVPLLKKENSMMYIDGKYYEREIVTIEEQEDLLDLSTGYNVRRVQRVQWIEKPVPYWLESQFQNKKD